MISVLPLAIQAMTGIIFILSYLAYYAQLAGYSASMSFKINVTYSVLAVVGNITSWFITDRLGRRNLTIHGLSIVTVILFIAGGLGTQTSDVHCVQGVIAMFCLYGFFYNATIGATAYNLVTEAPTSRLRAKTVSMGMALQAACYVGSPHISAVLTIG
jgi:MFS transporter, SP family, general alpha glucoside:H+ symporter